MVVLPHLLRANGLTAAPGGAQVEPLCPLWGLPGLPVQTRGTAPGLSWKHILAADAAKD